jgi:predicted DNA-binding transcriptional regulator AlpA
MTNVIDLAQDHVIDLAQEQPLTLHQASRVLSKSHPTIYRYATTGCRGVRLETIRLGKQRLTSLSSIQRFLDRLADVQE